MFVSNGNEEHSDTMDQPLRSAAPPVTAQLQALANTTSDGILTIDTASIIRFANSAVEDILGYSPDELVDAPLTRIMDDALADHHYSGFAHYLETGEQNIDWSDVQLPGQRKDGSEVPLSVSFSEFTVDGERFFTGIIRDITERNARERDLERYRAAVETVADGVYTLDENARFLTVNTAFTELTGYSRDELLGADASMVTGEQGAAEFDDVQVQLERGDTDVATVETTLNTANSGTRPVEIRVSLFPLGDDTSGRAGVVRDITGRKQRKQQLAGLHEFAQSLTAAETMDGVCHLAMATANDLFPNLLTTAYLYNDEAGRLEPVSHTPAVLNVGAESGELFTTGHSLPWTVFQTQERHVCMDSQTDDVVAASETPLRSVVAVPFGSYGVLVSGATTTEAFDWEAVRLVDLLATDIETALERVEREETLRDHAAELEEYTAALERVNRINDVIRDLTTMLVQAGSREEIEQAVCTKLANTHMCQFAWIGAPTATGDDITPRTSAGVDRGYLDAISVTDDESPTGQTPGGRVATTHEVQVQNNLSTDPPFEPWRDEALQRGYRACIAVPLVYKDVLYGVLNLYLEEPDVFDDLAVAVLEELGQMVAYAINAAERQTALASDSTVELQFDIENPDLLAAEFTRETESRFKFESLVEQADGSLRMFFIIDGATPDEVIEYSQRSPQVQNPNHIAETDDGHLFEATVGTETFLANLLDYGASPTELTTTPTDASLTVELAQSGDNQSFLRTMLNTHDGVTLRARRELDRPIQSDAEFQTHFEERLTEREEEVLRTAYYAGFFESPRESSGSEVAEMLDVSQPTVNRHLRSGESKLLEMVFENRAGDE